MRVGEDNDEGEEGCELGFFFVGERGEGLYICERSSHREIYLLAF